MIFNIGWLATILIWCSGYAGGRCVAAIYAGQDTWFGMAAISVLALVGTFLGARIVRN